MTVFVHRANSSVGYGEHRHSADDPDVVDGGDRAWGFSCDPGCEARILRDVEHTAHSAEAVPFTVEESRAAEVQEKVANREVANMAQALREVIKNPQPVAASA